MMIFDPVDVVACRVTTLLYTAIAIHVHCYAHRIHNRRDQSCDGVLRDAISTSENLFTDEHSRARLITTHRISR